MFEKIHKNTVKEAKEIRKLVHGDRPGVGILWDGTEEAVVFFRLPRTRVEWETGFLKSLADFMAFLSQYALRQTKQKALVELTSLLSTVVHVVKEREEERREKE